MNTEQKINAIMRYIIAGSQEEKDNIVEEIKDMIEPIAKEKQTENIEDVISEIFVEIGMPCHIVGYRYSVYAVKLVVENSDIINAVVKELYPAVAKKFGTTASRVERGIRHSVECTWDRSDIDVIEKYFGNTVSLTKCKPTNSEFIARIANIVRRRIRNG
jgi:two-component system response regulator (stage 0 sporulation protein A)